jgi:hypothetical protein
MKASTNFTLTSAAPDKQSRWRALYTLFLGIAALWIAPGRAHAQQLLVGEDSGVIGEYSVAKGTATNPTFITGLSEPWALLLSGNNLFVADRALDTVSEYNATTGAPNITFSVVTGLGAPSGLALSGNDLWVTNYNTGVIGEYNATTGAPMAENFIQTPLNCLPTGLAFSGTNLLVACSNLESILEYSTTTGVLINSSFITGLSTPWDLLVSGNNLYVANVGSGVIGEYSLTTGAAINADLITVSELSTGIALSGNDLFAGNDGLNTIGEYNANTGAVIHESFITGLAGPGGLVVVGSPVLAPCTLTDSVSYNATTSTLTMNFTVGNNETSAVTWSAWLTYQDTITPVFTPISQPVTNPAAHITKTFPDLPAEGTVGVLSTLTTATGGIVCSSFVAAKTATP